MDISAIDAVLGTSASDSDRGLGSMKSEDFLKILITEMQNQDPLEPTDTSDMISQVSQIRSIELSSELTDTLDLLARQQRMGGASELIGKYVQAIVTADDGSASLTEGVVTSVYFNSDGSAVLELDTGQAVSADDVIRVTTVEEVEATASG
jgi:flagellar basal-body rod modification protein FlgD